MLAQMIFTDTKRVSKWAFGGTVTSETSFLSSHSTRVAESVSFCCFAFKTSSVTLYGLKTIIIIQSLWQRAVCKLKGIVLCHHLLIHMSFVHTASQWGPNNFHYKNCWKILQNIFLLHRRKQFIQLTWKWVNVYRILSF